MFNAWSVATNNSMMFRLVLLMGLYLNRLLCTPAQATHRQHEFFSFLLIFGARFFATKDNVVYTGLVTRLRDKNLPRKKKVWS